jgi:hypothetical protein
VKRALEAVLVVAVLALGGYVVHKALVRRELALHPPVANPAAGPGEDSEKPAVPETEQRRGVVVLPMVKLSKPPKTTRRAAAVPPPVAAP